MKADFPDSGDKYDSAIIEWINMLKGSIDKLVKTNFSKETLQQVKTSKEAVNSKEEVKTGKEEVNSKEEVKTGKEAVNSKEEITVYGKLIEIQPEQMIYSIYQMLTDPNELVNIRKQMMNTIESTKISDLIDIVNIQINTPNDDTFIENITNEYAKHVSIHPHIPLENFGLFCSRANYKWLRSFTQCAEDAAFYQLQQLDKEKLKAMKKLIWIASEMDSNGNMKIKPPCVLCKLVFEKNLMDYWRNITSSPRLCEQNDSRS
jgi:hypothetical protein